MKYLIDGINKNVLSLANQYKYLKEGDEYKVYDDTFSNIEGLDLVQINNYYIDEEGNEVYGAEDDDSRKMKITADFDSALEWCDCYVCFRSIPYELTTQENITETTEQIEALLTRIESAKTLGKKIYLGNMFSDEFSNVIKNYDNCINTLITKENLEEIKDYGYYYRSTSTPVQFSTTMIIGTNSSSGKFSCALKVKKYYEDLGEKVILIHTEETFPFLDDQDGTIYGFCRNFSELTTDQDFMYLQALVAKIYEEQRPERIIFVTQSGFGIDGIINSYQDTENGYKMKGLWDSFIYRSFGVNDVIISANYNRLEVAERIIDYFRVRISSVDTYALYINPREYAGDDIIKYTTEDKSSFYKVVPKATLSEMDSLIKGFVLQYPDIRVNCEYGDYTNKVVAFKSEKNFKFMLTAFQSAKLLNTLNLYLTTVELDEYSLSEEVKKQIEENYSNYQISEEDFSKVKTLLGW